MNVKKVRKAIIYENHMWITFMNNRFLVGINIKNWKYEYIVSFPDDVMGIELREELVYEDKLYIFPYVGNKIYIFDLLKKSFCDEKVISVGNISNYFIQKLVLIEKTVYLVSGRMMAHFLSFNLESEEIKEEIWCERQIEKLINKSADIYFSGVHTYEKKCWMILYKTNLLIEINFEDKKVYLRKVGNNNLQLNLMTSNGKVFWFSQWDSMDFIKWDSNTNYYEIIKNNYKFEDNLAKYDELYYSNNSVYVTMIYSKVALKIDEQNIEELFDEEFIDNNKELGMGIYANICEDGEKIIFPPRAINSCLVYDMKTRNVSKIVISAVNNEIDQKFTKYIRDGEQIRELRNIMDLIKKNSNSIERKKSENIGRKIYKSI